MVWYRHWLDARFRLIGVAPLAFAFAGLGMWLGDPVDLILRGLLLIPLGAGLSPRHAQHIALTMPVARWKWVLSGFVVNYAILSAGLILHAGAKGSWLSFTGHAAPWNTMAAGIAAQLALALPFLAGAELMNLAAEKIWVTGVFVAVLFVPFGMLHPVGSKLALPGTSAAVLGVAATVVLLSFALMMAQRREYS